MKMAIITLLFCALAAGNSLANTVKCGVCNKSIEGQYYQFTDKARGEKMAICSDCGNLDSRCFSCGIPVKTNFTKLTDGRLTCDRCSKNAISDDEEAKKICLAARDELNRFLSRFLTFPETNVVLTIADRFTLESLFKTPGYDRRCPAIFGATQSHPLTDRLQVHTIHLLSSLNKERLSAVAAHEFAHTWLNENLRPERKAVLSSEAIEGFCEWIAFQLMDQRHNEFEKRCLRENPYTRGQLDAFLAAETRHGFNTVVEWMKSGEAEKLDADDTQRVREVSAREPVHSTPAPMVFPTAVAVALPETLALKTISGPAGRRFALINDRTFAETEKATIRLATTNLQVRCLEIRTNSVLVQIETTGEKQELLLPED